MKMNKKIESCWHYINGLIDVSLQLIVHVLLMSTCIIVYLNSKSSSIYINE